GMATDAAVEKVPGSSRPARSKRIDRAMQAPAATSTIEPAGAGVISRESLFPSYTYASRLDAIDTYIYSLALLEIVQATGVRRDRRHMFMAHLGPWRLPHPWPSMGSCPRLLLTGPSRRPAPRLTRRRAGAPRLPSR